MRALKIRRILLHRECIEIQKISEYVYNWISRQNNVGEESLTDWLLYESSLNLPSRYMQFTRHEEARKTGADWEWWLIGNNKSLKLRVQAKQIHNKTDCYPSIAYTNKYGLQIDKLLSDAKASNSYPIYAFYIAPSKPNNVICNGRNILKSHEEGVYLSSAQKTYNKFIKNGKSKVSTNDVLSISNPLSCLYCCNIKQDSIERALAFIQHYFEDNSSENLQGIYEQLPQYILSLLESKDGKTPDWWEKEFDRDITDINAILVTDFRKGF